MYLIINRLFTCYSFDIKKYKYGPCLNKSNKPKSGLIGIVYIIYATFGIEKLIRSKYRKVLWGFSGYNNKWYNLSLFNIGNLEGVVKNLKWLEQGDKAHIKCLFLYNELVFLSWIWVILLYQLVLIYLYKLSKAVKFITQLCLKKNY